ncbi:MAG TPA: hypothetical protein DEQ14_08480 [Treponema sp.]|nr:hypothetical protein [Treponema sp.]
MKKNLCVFVLLFGCGLALFAQEAVQETAQTSELRPIDKRFVFGIGWSNIQATGDFWGTADFGFLLYKNEKHGFNIRNSIMFDGGTLKSDGTEYGIYFFSNKLIMESMSHNNLFRYYSFLQGGVGIYANENKDFFSTPVAYNFGIGIGLDIFVEKNTSIFFDYTFLYNSLENKLSFTESLHPKFTMGMRHFF